MRAAAAAKGGAKLLAVTVLTSLDAAAAAEIYGDFGPKHAAGVGNLVLKFARDADAAGCDGVVCSPQEIASLRRHVPTLALVTPGVRPVWASADDQKRVMTPGVAVKAGATYLVIGRPITKPPEKIGSPAAAAKLIAEEIVEALR
jgi:orotidine-5'-phosphate decarboxylase